MAERVSPNKLLLVVAVLGVVCLIWLLIGQRQAQYEPIRQLPSYDKDSAPQDGDTQADTIKALQAYAREAVGKAEALNSQTKSQMRQVHENASHVARITQDTEKLKQAAEQAHLNKRDIEAQLKALTEAIEALEASQFNNTSAHELEDIPMGFGFDHLKAQREEGRWFEPLNINSPTEGDDKAANTSPTFSPFLGARKTSRKSSTPSPTPPIETPTVHPVFTLPKDAILYDAVALTALVGRIPVEGVTPDPYPVKVLIGRENLAANGHRLPNVEGMLFSGVGIGDWNLSCVSVRLHSATFIFTDGRIVNHTQTANPIGYISDPTGWPCVKGEFRTNAPKFLRQRVMLAGLGAAGNAYAEGQLERQRSGLTGNTTSNLTGSIGKLVAGSTVKSATDEVGRWLLARQKQSFDAVVVAPGAAVVIHLDTTLALDHVPDARRVNYLEGESEWLDTLD